MSPADSTFIAGAAPDRAAPSPVSRGGAAPDLPATGVNYRYAVPIALVHLIALLVFVPWLFSWTGMALAVAGLYVFGTLGINIGYHRLLSHCSFRCPRWLEYALVVSGLCCVQDSPLIWVAHHRKHHHHSDEAHDPHSPRASFLWSHMGWLIADGDDTRLGATTVRYAPDLQRDRFYLWLAANDKWALIAFGSWALFYVAGFLAISATGGTAAAANQFGLSLVVWSAALRVVLVWHITWSVNSVTHRWGYQRFATGDDSRNNPLIGILSNGEGWHNNHHFDPQAARHGLGWREPDIAWLTIALWHTLGLVCAVTEPRWAQSHLPGRNSLPRAKSTRWRSHSRRS
jgi:fatty-acid desaturase